MARDTARLTCSRSITLSPIINPNRLVCLLTEVWMEELIMILSASSKILIALDVWGIDNHQITDIPIVTLEELSRPRIDKLVIFHQYVYTGQCKTIQSSGQLRMVQMSMTSPSRLLVAYSESLSIIGMLFPSASEMACALPIYWWRMGIPATCHPHQWFQLGS